MQIETRLLMSSLVRDFQCLGRPKGCHAKDAATRQSRAAGTGGRRRTRTCDLTDANRRLQPASPPTAGLRQNPTETRSRRQPTPRLNPARQRTLFRMNTRAFVIYRP